MNSDDLWLDDSFRNNVDDRGEDSNDSIEEFYEQVEFVACVPSILENKVATSHDEVVSETVGFVNSGANQYDKALLKVLSQNNHKRDISTVVKLGHMPLIQVPNDLPSAAAFSDEVGKTAATISSGTVLKNLVPRRLSFLN